MGGRGGSGKQGGEFSSEMKFFKEKRSFSDGVYGSLNLVHLKMRPKAPNG